MDINESMNLDEQIKQAAKQAVIESNIQDTAYDGQYMFQDSERVRVHYKGPNRRFSVDIFYGGHPNFPADTSLDVLTKQLTQELLKHERNS
jgi:hypothetical protein